jgi:hypothetical protein
VIDRFEQYCVPTETGLPKLASLDASPTSISDGRSAQTIEISSSGLVGTPPDQSREERADCLLTETASPVPRRVPTYSSQYVSVSSCPIVIAPVIRKHSPVGKRSRTIQLDATVGTVGEASSRSLISCGGAC